MDLLANLTTFLRIADTGSISKAARSLELSVAMASRQLRALEKELGVELMRRTTRRLLLTEPGSELVTRARALLASVQETREVLRPGVGAVGQVVMSLPVSFGLGQMGPLFPALLAQHPRLKLDLRFEDRIVDLFSDGVDLAIRAGVLPPDSPFLVARRLATVDRVLCAAPRLLRKHRRLASIEDLASVPCIIQGSTTAEWTFETGDGSRSVLVDGRVRTNNVFAIRELALAGVGVARLPRWIVEEDLRQRRLCSVLPAVQLPLVDIVGMFPRGARSSTAIRTVLDYLATELPKRLEKRTLPPKRSA